MRHAAISLAILGAGLLLSGCVSFSPYAVPAGEQAILHMVRVEGEPSGAQSPPHWFFAYDNADCRLTPKGGFLRSISWDVGNEGEAPLAGGERLYLRSITKDVRLGGASITPAGPVANISWTYCTTMASFTPEAGRRYRVHHALAEGGCQVDLVDDTNRAPPSFRLEPLTARCEQFNQRDDGDTAKP